MQATFRILSLTVRSMTDHDELSTSAGGGYSQKKWVGVSGPLPKTLTLFMPKICDILYPIYDLTKNSKPYL